MQPAYTQSYVSTSSNGDSLHMIQEDRPGTSAGQSHYQQYADDDGWSPCGVSTDAHNSGDDNFKVVIRIRPPLPRELRGTPLRPYQCTTHVDDQHRIITISENLHAALSGGGASGAEGGLHSTYRLTFDHVYDQHCSQEDVYMRSAQHVVLSILDGYNAAIIAYGQTATGKTFTMEGEMEGPMRGIIPRTVEDIFVHIVNDPDPGSKYLVRSSYLQIYNEVISDLLKPEKSNLTIREDRRRGVYVEGLSEWVVRSPGEVYQLMGRGQSMRSTGATKMNEVSSRSHAVCTIIVEKCTAPTPQQQQQQGGDQPDASISSQSSSWSRPSTAGVVAQSIKVGKLNLVDLAGSERVHITGATGKRLEESKKINASLSALGNVIAALTDRRERSHIPYRDSKLTRILEDSLGGNCRTTMICTIAPAPDAFPESLSTLKFANRAKNIRNDAHVNEDLDQRTLLRKYERELRKLRAELTRRNRELVDKRHLLEVEEQKRRAEADKLAALTALEKRSREFLREKEEKRALEAKIKAMQSQLLVGGGTLEDAPAFRAILAREHKRIRGEYEARLRELESERQGVEEDRAQVDRYKLLLLKQRDIMIALTARLNERDEQIMALQEELEAYDSYQRQLEDGLDDKTGELIALRRAAFEQAATSPGWANTPALQMAFDSWADGRHANGGTVATSSAPRPADGAPLVRSHSLAASVSAAMNGHGATEVPGGLEEGMGALAVSSSSSANGRPPMSSMGSESDLRDATIAREASKAQAAALTQQVEVLSGACRNAQKERSALQQILQSKVKRMMQDMVAEVSAERDSDGEAAPSSRILTKLRALETVLDKIGEAIQLAPPIIAAS